MAKIDKISWIGCGKVGKTLARAAREAGFDIGIVTCKNPSNIPAALKFIGAGAAGDDAAEAVDSGSIHIITTNDDSIEDVVRELDSEAADHLAGHYFFHTSGSISSKVLEPLQKKGAEIGSIHPLQVFADPEKALETLPGIYYAIEGTEKAMVWAVQFVAKLQGKLLLIPSGRKVLYHIAGVFASNYLTVLVRYITDLMQDIGEDPEEAYQAFLPLMVGALTNIEALGAPAAMTGPVARGDVATIKRHIQALEDYKPEVLRAYKLLGEEATEMMAATGRITPDIRKRLLELLQD